MDEGIISGKDVVGNVKGKGPKRYPKGRYEGVVTADARVMLEVV